MTELRTIVAIIKPFRLESVLSILPRIGARSVHHTEARGYGRQKTHLDDYNAEPNATDFVPKVRLEFQIAESDLPTAIEAIREAARTGRMGDGKIFVFRPVAVGSLAGGSPDLS